MGLQSPRDLFHLPKFNVDVGVECLSCGRIAVFCPIAMAMHFIQIQRKTTWPISDPPFRCRCGSPNIRIVAVAESRRPKPLPEQRRPLLPLYVTRRG